MEDNIEVKDVQKTEYLDKNGLDMLWAKVKENTHNQVEIERNRAVAKENSISDKVDNLKYFPYYNKYTESEIQYYELDDKEGVKLGSYGVNTKLSGNDIKIYSNSESSTINRSSISVDSYSDGNRNHFYVNVNSQPNLTLSDSESKIKAEIFTNEHTPVLSINEHTSSGRGDDLQLSANGIKMLFKTTKDIVTANNSTAHIGLDDDQTEYTYVAPLENGKVPEEYLDLSQYAKKSEITAGSNVNDVQVNGVSVTENKIANINPATKEKLGVVKVGDGLNVTDGTISVDKSSILIDLLSYGVEWDTTVADPACTRIGNMSYHKSLPIQSEYKGCLMKNGKVNYYLDPNDWSKKADGTPSVLDGTDGDVMVHIPKFYGKSGSNGNKRWVRITTTKIDSSWVEIPEIFVSAYRITTFDDSGTPKIASVVNTTTNYRGGSNRANYDRYLSTDKFRTDLGKSRTNISRATMRTYANNSRQELLCYEFYKWVFYWAYVIEYANFNSQKEFNSELTSDGYHQGGLGYGVSTVWLGDWGDYNRKNTLVPCGYTNEFGNFSGTKNIIIQADDSSPVTVTANRWRGFENPFGDIETCLDGIVLKMDSANSESKVYTTTDSSKFGDDTSVMNIAGIEESGRGYIIEFDLRETGEIIPQSSNNYTQTGSKYKCDYHSLNTDNTNNRMLLVGGDAQFEDMNGLGSFNSNNVDYADSRFGYRSVIRA